MKQEHQQHDRTAQAVTRQLHAMDCPRFEVGVREAVTGKVVPVSETPEELIHSLPWLKHKNATGSDIYLRPAGSVGIVLVDDLKPERIKQMIQAGHTPSVVVQTSPGNLQTWVRVATEPIRPSLATAVARELADKYEGDPNASDWRHYGRLVGFTNRKPQHRQPDGRYPYVFLLQHRQVVAPGAATLLEQAAQREVSDAGKEVGTSPQSFYPPEGGSVSKLGSLFQAELQRRLTQFPNSQDMSRLDYVICKTLAVRYPAATPAELVEALRIGSPDLAKRKVGHIDDYLHRTVSKVLNDFQVQRAREKDA